MGGCEETIARHRPQSTSATLFGAQGYHGIHTGGAGAPAATARRRPRARARPPSAMQRPASGCGGHEKTRCFRSSAPAAGCSETIIDPVFDTHEAVITVAFDGKPGDTLRVFVTIRRRLSRPSAAWPPARGRGSSRNHCSWPRRGRPLSIPLPGGVCTHRRLRDRALRRRADANDAGSRGVFRGVYGLAELAVRDVVSVGSYPIKVERSFGA